MLKAGAYADITLFDADTVIDAADFQHSTLPARGIGTVIVNGGDRLARWQIDGRAAGPRVYCATLEHFRRISRNETYRRATALSPAADKCISLQYSGLPNARRNGVVPRRQLASVHGSALSYSDRA